MTSLNWVDVAIISGAVVISEAGLAIGGFLYNNRNTIWDSLFSQHNKSNAPQEEEKKVSTEKSDPLDTNEQSANNEPQVAASGEQPPTNHVRFDTSTIRRELGLIHTASQSHLPALSTTALNGSTLYSTSGPVQWHSSL